MAGIPTEHLAEQIGETNRRLAESNDRLADEIRALAAEMRDSNRRVADAIGGLSHDFGNFRVEVAKELGAIRAETARDLGEINSRLETTAVSLRFAGRGVAVLIPVVISLIGAAIGIAWYAGRLDSRVERVEKSVGAVERPGAVRR